jgi:CheY-like chemotaxis protein
MEVRTMATSQLEPLPPVDQQPAEERGTPSRPRDLPGILVVDDAAAVRTGLGEALRREGFAVWVAPDGQQALDLYRRCGGSIDLVVMDQRMPGLDGLQTLAALRALNPDVRCCFLTADPDSDGRLEQGGATCVLHKPMGPDEVARVLRRLVWPA